MKQNFFFKILAFPVLLVMTYNTGYYQDDNHILVETRRKPSRSKFKISTATALHAAVEQGWRERYPPEVIVHRRFDVLNT